jgi:bifunctional non-homologous end joining protein LigD
MLVRASLSASHAVVITTRDSTLPALVDIEAGLRALAGGEALFEGYLVAHARHGAFEEALREPRHLVFYANDLLYCNGHDLTGVALHGRKRALRNLFLECPRVSGQVAFGDHVRGDGSSFWRRACAMGFEGIVSKSREAPYDPLRYHWIWSPPSTAERQPDSLIPCA